MVCDTRGMARWSAVLLLVAVGVPAAATELGIQRSKFTLDGTPRFLLGASYYGALGVEGQTPRRDLDDLQRLGFNWIRVWATWAAFDNPLTVVDQRGGPREPFLGRLERLVADCDRRGMVVDVTFTRDGPAVGNVGLNQAAVYRRAIETVARRLKDYRNWYVDLGNERNIRDARFVGFEELCKLRRMVKKIDPGRLVTASHAGDIPGADLRRYLLEVKVDFISPHRPRNGRSAARTEAKTRGYLAAMKGLGRVVPVIYQEPFRRGFSRGWEPGVDDYLTDAKGAFLGGAAGWCFHNGDQRRAEGHRPRRSFDLRDGRLFEQLDAVEREALQRLGEWFRRRTTEAGR